VTGLALGRIAVGVVSVARPAVAATMLGVNGATNPQAPYLTRLFGVREIGIGAATLLSRGPARRTLVLAGIAVDGGDAMTGVLAIRDGSVSARQGAVLAATGAGAVLAGVAGLRARS
jgi:hypothetical protein